MESEILEKYVSKSSCLCLFFKDFAISYLFIYLFFFLNSGKILKKQLSFLNKYLDDFEIKIRKCSSK